MIDIFPIYNSSKLMNTDFIISLDQSIIHLLRKHSNQTLSHRYLGFNTYLRNQLRCCLLVFVLWEYIIINPLWFLELSTYGNEYIINDTLIFNYCVWKYFHYLYHFIFAWVIASFNSIINLNYCLISIGKLLLLSYQIFYEIFTYHTFWDIKNC